MSNSPNRRAASPAEAAASRRQPQASWSKIAPYAALSFGSFLCGFLVLGLMLWRADTLVRLGLTGGAYYIAMLPLSLAMAAFLFGVMRSYAVYSGKHFGGMLQLGGPVVGAALTVIGGFVLVPQSSAFPLSVFVHGEEGVHQVLLRNSGKVILDLGGDRRSEEIGDKGQAFFPAIPSNFRGQEVPVFIDAAGYELVSPAQRLRLDGSSLYLAVRVRSQTVVGSVQDEDGNPVPGASITMAGMTVQSDAAGQFAITIPSERVKSEFSMQTVADGFRASRTTVVPGGNDVVIVLRRPQ
jgi:hypothetical protein